MTSGRERREPLRLVSGQAAVDVLRLVALHRETARLLDLRAGHAATPTAAAYLRHRAAGRRAAADRLAATLPRRAAEGRHPSGQA